MPVNVTNDAEISFGTPTAAWGTPAWIVVTFGSAGNEQNIELAGSPAATEINREVVIPAGDLDINFASSSDGLDDAILASILNEALDEIAITISLHTGDPGSSHTANAISGNGYSNASVSAGGFSATVT